MADPKLTAAKTEHKPKTGKNAVVDLVAKLPSFEEWAATGKALVKKRSRLLWELADWWGLG
jgi:hypothetical protein